jgi:hypothetical protein
MGEVLDAEDVVLQEIEQILDDMYERAALLHEELVNEAWLKAKLEERTGAIAEVTADAEKLLTSIILDVSSVRSIDMGDVRKFINKWLPAHLMYRLTLQLWFLNKKHEKIDVRHVEMGYSSFFWDARTLNGTWVLDGSLSLDVIRKEDNWGVTIT